MKNRYLSGIFCHFYEYGKLASATSCIKEQAAPVVALTYRLCNLEAHTVTQICFRVFGTATCNRFGHNAHLPLRRSRTVDSVIVKQTPILDSYIAMIRKAEYHSHPPPARAAGGGGGGAATAADTATVSNC